MALHWSDNAFRRTILTIGYEEATFYEPRNADLDIRALVVVALRNSLLEDLAASRATTESLGLAEPVLTDSEIPSVTSAAIEHFRDAPTRATAALENPTRTDVFGTLRKAYPHAWHVLSQIANSSDLECNFVASPAATPRAIWESNTEEPSESLVTVVSSGMDPSFDEGLVTFLNYVKEGEVPYFFTDSFKGITRNPDKLFRIIDFVLGHDAAVVTHNYLLTPTYASRRAKMLRPFHFTSEMQTKLSDQSGLCQKHKNVLDEIKDSIESG
jgi:hypothetical protein